MGTPFSQRGDGVVFCLNGPLAGHYIFASDWPHLPHAVGYRHTGAYKHHTWLDVNVEVWAYVDSSDSNSGRGDVAEEAKRPRRHRRFTSSPAKNRVSCKGCRRLQPPSDVVSGWCECCLHQPSLVDGEDSSDNTGVTSSIGTSTGGLP